MTWTWADHDAVVHGGIRGEPPAPLADAALHGAWETVRNAVRRFEATRGVWNELAGIALAAAARLEAPAARDWLERQAGPGCPWLAGCPLLGVARAALDPDDMGPGWWRQIATMAGEPIGIDTETAAIVVPCMGIAGDPWDLVAIDPRRPARWWQATGMAHVVGAAPPELVGLDPAADGISGGAMRWGVWPSPLAWLRAGCPPRTGAIVDMDCWIGRHGEEVEAVFVDEAQARAFERRRKALLRPARPALPPVLVSAGEDGRAAA